MDTRLYRHLDLKLESSLNIVVHLLFLFFYTLKKCKKI